MDSGRSGSGHGRFRLVRKSRVVAPSDGKSKTHGAGGALWSERNPVVAITARHNISGADTERFRLRPSDNVSTGARDPVE